MVEHGEAEINCCSVFVRTCTDFYSFSTLTPNPNTPNSNLNLRLHPKTWNDKVVRKSGNRPHFEETSSLCCLKKKLTPLLTVPHLTVPTSMHRFVIALLGSRGCRRFLKHLPQTWPTVAVWHFKLNSAECNNMAAIPIQQEMALTSVRGQCLPWRKEIDQPPPHSQ